MVHLPAPDLGFLTRLPRNFHGKVRTDAYSRVLYATDASIYQIEPLAVAFPRTTDDVQILVKACAREGVPLLARGGGSSQAGQAIGRAVVIDLSRHLNRVLEVNAEEQWVRAETGAVCDSLTRAVRPAGLRFGCEPSSSNRATVGGMVANNASGSRSILYGQIADHVLDAAVVLSDGSTTVFRPQPGGAALPDGDTLADRVQRGVAEVVAREETAIRQRFPRTWRTASGYRLNYLLPGGAYSATRPPRWSPERPYPAAPAFNLAQLLAGSEGTLAVMTEVRLGLVTRPVHAGLGLLQFESVQAAADAAPAILETEPSAVELTDQMLLRLTRSVPAFNRMLTFVDGDPGAVLVVEYCGDSEPEVQAGLDRLEARARAGDLGEVQGDVRRVLDEREQARIWEVGKAGLGLLMSTRGDAKPIPFIEDVAVPVEHLGRYVSELERLFAAYSVRAGYYAHASAGCLHIRPLINTKSVEQIAAMRAIAEGALKVVIALGGAMSGEHGHGLSRSCWNERLFGPQVYRAFRDVKQLFDPQGILNPGKVVDAPDMTESLRYGAGYRALSLPTILDFSLEGGFAGAVEQCNGAGVCRKADGVMCPSFQATREEEYSTRGRANALRAAISGLLPPDELTGRRMFEMLDLCLECKAECPSAVDMAKIKYQFLAQYAARHGLPLRSQLFARLPQIARMVRPVAPLANAAMNARPLRRLFAQTLGIAPQHRLPAFVSRTFRMQFEAAHRTVVWRTARPPVVLFVDTFTEYQQPENGLAAARLLEAAGFNVELAAGQGCCGRTLISKGLLKEARARARENVEVLAPYARRGVPIIGLEPACLLTLRDESLDLLPGDPDARLVAVQSQLIEEFLAGQAEQGRLNLRWQPRVSRVLVHAHCYQKALTGIGPVQAMLRLPGWEVEEIGAGCCGLAGSWGYEAEHYALSQAIGESRLFPAVRNAAGDTLIAASGVSCREQIRHFTGRTAYHPALLLAEALSDSDSMT